MSNKPKQKILYGAGAMGKRAFEYYTKIDEKAVFCFADTFKGGTEYCGKYVISFEEFLEICNDYEVVICIFNLFEVGEMFAKNRVNEFIIWKDYIALPIEERLSENYFERLKQIEVKNDLAKIIYGAGEMGEYALRYYGEDNVFAFADKSKHGEEYLGKPVLSPQELQKYEKTHDIIVCVYWYREVTAYLESLGVKKFRLWETIDDLRVLEYRNEKDTLFDYEVINKLIATDFIQTPEKINNFHNLYLKLTREWVSPLGYDKISYIRTYNDNKWYGFYNEMAKYANRNVKYFDGPALCHGIRLDGTVKYDFETQNIMEAGSNSEHMIRERNYECLYFTCGPYMHYVEPFYNEDEFLKYKRLLGKNLLVFPVHTLPTIEMQYDYNHFIEFAVTEAKQFDSLTVCVHHSDYKSDVTNLFRDSGARIVTCGYISDPSFVRRLKTIISSADAVLTNGLGSHIAYSVGMDKPIKYFSQKVEYSITAGTKGSKNIGKDDFPLKVALPTDEYKITQELLDVLDGCYTFSKIKTKEEMGAIFDISKRVLLACDYKRSRYTEGLRQTYRELQNATTPEEKLQFRLMKEALPDDYDDYLKKLGV